MVGVVGAAGYRGPRAVGGQRGAAVVVAVQVEEVVAALDRNAQAAGATIRGKLKMLKDNADHCVASM